MSLLKRLGIVLLIFAIAGTYYFITRQPKVQPAVVTPPVPVTFFCTIGGKFQVIFATSSVALLLSDGRTLSLPQTMSGSGVRYEATTTGADIVFWNKGDNAFITENEKTTYEDCTAARVVLAETAGYETYTDQPKSFTFTLPTDFSIAGSAVGYSQDWWSVDATTTGAVLAHVTVSKEYMPGTNFGDAWFTVGTSADPSAIAECLTNPKGNFGSTTLVTINGASFTKITFTGAGAGNRYDTTSYRTVRDNQCYAVEYTIHYGVIENYPVGAVKEFDEAKVQMALEGLVQSFRFLP
jgi:membrane-bound inhibitor of C-type lysozyme